MGPMGRMGSRSHVAQGLMRPPPGPPGTAMGPKGTLGPRVPDPYGDPHHGDLPGTSPGTFGTPQLRFSMKIQQILKVEDDYQGRINSI